MGMAASQARFLGITARKTNTEYEGQQVNQQRTALANQSANLFNQLLGLQIPSPPSKSDAEYTKTVYAFTDESGATATITSIANNPDSSTSATWPKVIKYTVDESVQKSYRNSLATSAMTYTQNTKQTDKYYQSIVVGSNSAAQLSLIHLDEEYTALNNSRTNIYNTIKAASKEETDEKKEAEATAGTNNLQYFDVGTGDDKKRYYVNGDSTKSGQEVTVYDKDGKAVSGTYKLSYDESSKKYSITGSGTGAVITGNQELTATSTIKNDGKIFVGGGDKTGSTISDMDQANINKLLETYGSLGSEGEYYKYTINGVDYYIPSSQTNNKGGVTYEEDPTTGQKTGGIITSGTWDGNNTFKVNTTGTDTAYGYYVQSETEAKEKTTNARVTYDSSGRLQSIVVQSGSDEITHSVTVNSVTDEEKYEDAMNQYTYDYAQYEKTVQDINAQTEAIQAQDRTLELRLKQLDTEQEALTQEMDAIKKVIDKNVETTFKTFA